MDEEVLNETGKERKQKEGENKVGNWMGKTLENCDALVLNEISSSQILVESSFIVGSYFDWQA